MLMVEEFHANMKVIPQILNLFLTREFFWNILILT